MALPPFSLIAHLARPHLGLVTRPRLLEHLTPEQIERCLGCGFLELAQPRVYRVAGSPDTFGQRLLAATLASGAVASHRSAAVLWKLIEGTTVVEVTVPYNRNPRLRNVVVHRSRDLDPRHVSFVQGVNATNPLRTLVDAGAVIRLPQEVEDMLDRGLSTNLVTVVGVENMLAELARPGRDGAGVLGRVLDERALGRDRPDGLLEPRMARLLKRANLPPAVFQHPVRIRRRRFRIDFAYPELMIAIEVDGFDKWTRRRSFQEALERQNVLVGAGWTVLRFTWHDVVRRPAYVAGMIADQLRRRQQIVL